jgi:ParB family chromosome partitioning protein
MQNTSKRKTVIKIPINKIRLIGWLPTRKDMGDLVEPAKSLRRRGDVGVPVKVRPAKDGFYELIWGRRRLEAAMLAGLNEISAIIEEIDNDEEVLIQSTIENILRKDRNPVEEAELSEFWKAKFGKTYEEIARLIGVTPSYIYNRVQLLSQP